MSETVSIGVCRAWWVHAVMVAGIVVSFLLNHPARAADLKPLVERGRYLATAGDCVACHTAPGGHWYAPSLRAYSRDRLGSWTDAQLVTYLKTGAAPGKGVALGPMQETIGRSLSHLPDADLQAMATYLNSTANSDTEAKEQAASTEVAAVGAGPYLNHCAFCHGVNGRSMSGTIPALAGNGAVQALGPENVVRVVLGGLESTHGLGPMPAVGVGMADQDIADVTNYVRTAWGNNAPANAAPGAVADPSASEIRAGDRGHARRRC